MEKLLEIKNLHVEVEGKEILKGVNLTVNKGEMHAIMGANGSGKSTLAMALMGHPKYRVTQGEIIFNGSRINELTPDKRAKLGFYLSMQNPVEIEGVRFGNLIWQSAKILDKARSSNVIEFMQELKQKANLLGLNETLIDRNINQGFSGGEKKKSEILQMMALKPNLAIIDEVDSGLDIDSLKNVATKISEMKNGSFTGLLITHYQRIFNYIKPDFVHVMNDGRITETGKEEIVSEIEKSGYSSFN